MSSSTHHNATFTWPPTKSERVVVTGTFDSWSGDKHVLERDPATGYFSTTVPVPYGEKVAYKYVVDGQWMTREDEAKEWDSAGNMNNVYTAPHAPKASEPTSAASTTQNRALPTAAMTTTPAVSSASTQPTETRRSTDQRVSEQPSSVTTASQPTVNTPTSAAQTTEFTSSRTEDTSDKKKHGLAGLAAGAASAIGLHKGSHQGTTATASQSTGDVPPARSGHSVSPTGDHAPLSSTNAATAPSATENKPVRAVDQVKTKAENLVASSVPSSSTASNHVDSAPSPVVTRAPHATEPTVSHTTTSLSGLNLGAPIGGASAAYSPAHTTTTTSSVGAYNTSSSVAAEKPKAPLTEFRSAHTSTSDETAVAPKTEGPKTAIPQPAVVVSGAATASGMTSKPVSTETAAAPKDAGPRTAIPQPAVEGTTSAPATSTPANVPTGEPSTVPIAETVNAQAEKLTHAAQQVGTSAFAAISTAASGLVIGLGDAVHAVTGVDIVHKDPVSPLSPPPKILSDLEEGGGKGIVRDQNEKSDGSFGKARNGSATAMTVPFESQLKRSPRLAQTGFPLPTPASASSPSGTMRPFVHRTPSPSASLYKSEAQELRRRSWNLNNSQQPQISIEEAKRAGIDTKDLPTLENGPASARSAEALANTLTAPIPVAKDTAVQASSTARDVTTNNTFGQTPAVPEKSQASVAPVKTTAPAPVQQRSPVTTSHTDIPLPPAKDGLPAPQDDADIQAAKSVPRSSVTATGLHPTAPQVSAPVHGSMAGQSQSSGAAVRANNNAATASSPTSPKQPDVFSSNKQDKPAISAGDKKAEYKTDLPAQHETKNTNHKSVPMPVITSIGDNTKDRTQPSLADNAAKEVSSNPAAGTHEAKAEASAGMSNDVEGVPSRSYAKQPTDNNTAVTGLPLATTQKPVSELAPAPAAAAAPATPVKPVVVEPASANQTPLSTTDSTKKRKSGFMSKVKNVFHKDKAAK